MGHFARKLETTARLKSMSIDGSMKLSELLVWLDLHIADQDELDLYKDMAIEDLTGAPEYAVYAYWQALYSPGSGLLGLPADAPVVERKNPLFSLSIKPLHKCLFSRREGFRGTIVDTAWGYYSIVFVLFRKVIL